MFKRRILTCVIIAGLANSASAAEIGSEIRITLQDQQEVAVTI